MIVAECAQNYRSMIDAKLLIHLAQINGADLAKFQLFDSMKLYGQPNKYELSREDAETLFDYGQTVHMDVFFSIFDTERIKWCEEMGVGWYKIPYRMNGDKEIASAVAQTSKTVMVSTDNTSPAIVNYTNNYILLYCIPRFDSVTPSNIDVLDFKGIPNDYLGFSDHTIGLGAAKRAISMGAVIIEKHFALNHKSGRDAKWAMSPNQLWELKQWQMQCQGVP